AHTASFPLSLHDALPIWLLLVEQLAQHRDEDVDRVGGPALCVAEESAFGSSHGRVVRAIHLRAAVDQVQTRRRGHAEGKLQYIRSEEHTSELQSPYDLVC